MPSFLGIVQKLCIIMVHRSYRWCAVSLSAFFIIACGYLIMFPLFCVVRNCFSYVLCTTSDPKRVDLEQRCTTFCRLLAALPIFVWITAASVLKINLFRCFASVSTHWACCNLSVGVAFNVRFTTNGMCAKNNTHIYMARTSKNSVLMACDLYCCLLPQSETLRTCRSGFPIATSFASFQTSVWPSFCQISAYSRQIVSIEAGCRNVYLI